MATAEIVIEPVDVNFVLKDKVYEALKQAIKYLNASYASSTFSR